MMIRHATIDDLPRLVTMAEHFVGQTEYARHVGAHPEQIARLATWLIDSPSSVVLVTGEPLVGMIGMTVYPHPMSGELTGAEVVWWVEPEARGCGGELLRAAETWAIAQGAQRLQMVAPTDDVAQLYEHFGYELIERNYQRKV